MKRILIFSLVYYPRWIGGAEVAVKEITDRLPPGEFQFDMITLNGGGEKSIEKVGAVNVHRVLSNVSRSAKLLFPCAALWKALSLHKKNRYDATWSIMANYAGFAAVFFKMKNRKAPFILTLQEGDPIPYIKKRVRLVYPLFKKIFLKADRIQAISHYLADFARDMGATCPIDVVPNGVDYAHFSKVISPDQKKSIRKECGFADSDTILVTASRLVLKNGIGDVIESLAYLPPEVKFLILGTGHLEDELKAKVKHLDLANRVRFHGFVAHDKLPDYLAASDIFIRPSISEGLGNSFLEAMAAGIPVIATAVGGIPDFLKEGETGLFAEVHNPRSIAQKIEKLMRDRESRGHIIEHARELVREKYTWTIVAVMMRNIFHKI